MYNMFFFINFIILTYFWFVLYIFFKYFFQEIADIAKKQGTTFEKQTKGKKLTVEEVEKDSKVHIEYSLRYVYLSF